MPAGPPLSSRITAALVRWARLLRLTRVVPLLLVAGAVALVTVGAPMVSGAVTSFTDPVALESTATSAGRSVDAAGSDGSWFSGGSSSSDGSASSGGSVTSDGSVAEPLVRMGVDGDSPPPASAPVPPTPPARTPAPVNPFVPSPEASGAGSVPGSGSAPGPGSAPRSASAPGPGSAPRSASASTGATETSRSPQPAREAEAPAADVAAEPAPVARAAAADPTAETAVLTLVNEARADADCAPVTADPALAAVARAHSADMRDRDYFSHTSPEGLSPFDRAEQAGVDYSRAENIAVGQPDATAVMEAWLESPGHRANILDCDLTRLGVGVAEGTGGPWWTQLFGA